MKPEILVVIAVFALFALLEGLKTGFIRKQNEQPRDRWIEIITSIAVIVVTQPLVLLLSYQLMQWLAPSAENAWVAWPFLLQFGLLILGEDMLQYWWHRLAHRSKLLYQLHLVHHDVNYLSIRVVYRNNVFYYLFMPSLWIAGVFIYLGFGYAYAFYLAIKMTIITAAHSDVHWDEKLYAIPALRPVMWLLERTISTPATHSAHHGRYLDDEGTHYKGNYGNMLFLWDIIFGTAKITRRYPRSYGVENLPEISSNQLMFWPLIGSKKWRDSTQDAAESDR